MPRMLPPIHPGETIKEDVLEPLGMSVNRLAKALAVDAARLNEIVRGRRGISADTALRLARYLGTSAEFWMGLQSCMTCAWRSRRDLRASNARSGRSPRWRDAGEAMRQGLAAPWERGTHLRRPWRRLGVALGRRLGGCARR